MAIMIILLAAFILLDLASWRWGIDSTDSIDSSEWVKRQHWGEDLSDQLVIS